MKKALFVVVLVGLLLVACTSPTTPDSDTGGSTDGTTEITFMMWGAPEEQVVWQKVVDGFHTANPDINVKVEVSDWDSYWTKLNTLVGGGTAPDVFAMDAPLFLDWQSRGAHCSIYSPTSIRTPTCWRMSTRRP
jgi:multiple sugar transport system substrate-binding protein